jgi:hypothetical protein
MPGGPEFRRGGKVMKLRTLYLICGATFAATSFSATSRAELITFDDLPPPAIGCCSLIPDGYGGLQWGSGLAYANGLTVADGSTGYTKGTVSSTNIAYIGGNNATFSSSSTFGFESFYLTAAWNDGLNVSVTGKLNGTIVQSANFVVDTSSPSFEILNWSNINEVDFSSSGGTENPCREICRVACSGRSSFASR